LTNATKLFYRMRRLLVNALIGQTIGQGIFGPGHMGDGIGCEALQLLLGLMIKRLKVGALDPVGTFELLHYQLGVGQNLDPGGALFPGHLQSQNQGLILRHVVGGLPQILA